MSGRDYIAREFDEVTRSSEAWRGLLDQPRVQRTDIADADHTSPSPRPSTRPSRRCCAGWRPERAGAHYTSSDISSLYTSRMSRSASVLLWYSLGWVRTDATDQGGRVSSQRASMREVTKPCRSSRCERSR